MRITFVIPEADLSGGCRVVAIYAQKLMQRGHEVVVVSRPRRQPTAMQKLKALARGTVLAPPPRLDPSHFTSRGIDLREIDRFRAVEDRDVPDGDVVVASWWEMAEQVGRLSASKGAKAHFIQGYDATFYEGRDEARHQRALDVWRLPMHKIILSRWLVERARDVYGDNDVSHVPNSVEMEQFDALPREKQDRPTVGLLYAEPRCKGVDVALAAIEIARQAVPELQVIAFGREAVVPYLPLPQGAKYIFSPAQDAIRKIYAGCDVWLCGSRCEGFHLPPLEAMACRCPVVSTKVGGPMDIIDEGINGYLADIEDAATLGRRLVEVLTLEAERWKQMSEAAHRTAERYSWDDAAELFEAALEKAIERAGIAGAA